MTFRLPSSIAVASTCLQQLQQQISIGIYTYIYIRIIYLIKPMKLLCQARYFTQSIHSMNWTNRKESSCAHNAITSIRRPTRTEKCFRRFIWIINKYYIVLCGMLDWNEQSCKCDICWLAFRSFRNIYAHSQNTCINSDNSAVISEWGVSNVLLLLLLFYFLIWLANCWHSSSHLFICTNWWHRK